MKRFLVFGSVVMAMMFGVLSESHGAVINSSLGNTASGFLDGSIQPAFAVGGAQGGQPVPFDQGYGSDGLLSGNFSQSWNHNFGAIADTILSARITIGIYDHDSSASGSQLLDFNLDGDDLTAVLDGMFEAGGGALDSQYNEYTVNLTGGALAALADGNATVSLDLDGPGLVFALFPTPGIQETTTNGANLIFSTLSITTQDAGVIPEPGSVLVWSMLGVFGIVSLRRRRKLAQA